SKGHFVLLSTWPAWLLPVFIVAISASLAVLIRSRLDDAVPGLKKWRSVVLWAMQTGLITLILILFWQPAISVSELSSQQNIIAVVVDDSQSMSIADNNGNTREAAALAALNGGLLAGLQQRFQTRIYSLGSRLRRVDSPSQITPIEPATHID